MNLQAAKRQLTQIEALNRRLKRAHERRLDLAGERIEAGADVATTRDFELTYPSTVEIVEEQLTKAWPRLEGWLDGPCTSFDELGPWEWALLLEYQVPDHEWASEAQEQLQDLARGPVGPRGLRRAYDEQSWIIANLLLVHLERRRLDTRR